MESPVHNERCTPGSVRGVRKPPGCKAWNGAGRLLYSPERVVAVVTRGGDKPGTVYIHTDHLGSVEKLTDENGVVVEKRSYDPFGKRRNPVWGQPPPASFASKITLGFTGHESDDEVGLINARGRVYDPKVGRFLTIDPIVSNLYFGQTLNPYSYVLGNPLTLVDPSGFQPAAGVVSQPGYPDAPLPYEEIKAGAGSQVARYLNHEGPPPREDPPPKEKEDARQAGEVGAAAPPTDVDTTGSSPEHDPQAATTAPDEGFERSTIVRGGLGFAYGVGQAWLPGGYFVPSAQPQDFAFEFWRGAGQFTAGVVEVVAGAALVGGGGAAAGGGIAASVATGGASLLVTAVGGSAVTAGWAAVGHGATGIVAGLATIADSLSLSTGAGSPPAKGASGGERIGQRFTPNGKRQIDAENAAKNEGTNRCENCGTDVVPGQKSQRGVSPPSNQRERDHIIPRSKGGNGSPDNGQVLCRDCNNNKSNTMP
jgi:RHS repeat-associated protein